MADSFLKRLFPFPKITERWFQEHTVTDSVESYRKYHKWIKEYSDAPSDESKCRKILLLGTGKKPSTITNYLHKDPLRFYKIGEKTRRILDSITISLGYQPPGFPRRNISPKGQIALLVEMENIPSRYYHLEVIKGVIQAAARHKYSVTIHEITEDLLLNTIKQITLAYRPDGMIMIRVAPDERSFEYLRHEEIPTVLINADDKDYAPPVISNLVPVYDKKVENDFRFWLREMKEKNSAGNPSFRPEVVVIHMPAKDSHQSQRLDFIIRILKEEKNKFQLIEVPDYSFHQAYPVWQQHPNAHAYICFSDQIAVALKQFHLIGGLDWHHKIIGFDNSPLAVAENISSFGQELEEVKYRSFTLLKDSIETGDNTFEKTLMEVSFFKRG